MLRGRRRVVLVVVVLVVCIAAAVVIARTQMSGGHSSQARGGSKGTGGGTRPVVVVPQPAVPAGWRVRPLDGAQVAVPDGWRSTTNGVGGTTLAVWSPGPPAAGALPARCVVQRRPQWLLTFLHGHPVDWTGALQRDLASMEGGTSQGLGSVAVTGPHFVRVPGSAAALAFTARVKDTKVTQTGPTLQSADLLAALPNGTEVHVFCSGPAGAMPRQFANGVDSVKLG